MSVSLSPESITPLIQELVRIPSVNPSLAPDEGTGETEIAEFSAAWLSGQGLAAELQEAAPGRPNVVARAGTTTGPTLVLCAHLDTVSTAGMTIPPFEPTVEKGRLYGRGSYDMKGGVAAVMAAASILAESDLAGQLLVALVADEEYASAGAFHFAQRYEADACIITEPTDGALVLAHKGFLWAEVTTRGQAAHGSRWDLGVSAIGKMGAIITSLESHDRLVLRERTHPLVGPASMHPAMVNGGVGLSTYAPECVLKVERRTLPGEPQQVVETELREVIANSGQDSEVAFTFYRSPMECDSEAVVAHCVREAVAEVTGQSPPETGVGYWTDAGVFSEAGIPTVLYGPSGEGAHAATESVEIESVVTCARVLVASASRFCSI